MSRAYFVLVLLLSIACVSRPPVKLETEHGIVRAASLEDAERVAEALELGLEVRAPLLAQRDEPPVIWVVDHDLGGVRGKCFENRIELASAGEFVRVVVAHELVHWYIDGSPFDGMPQFVEEGLADYLSLELSGLVDARSRENQAIGALTVTRAGLDADVRAFLDLPREESRPLVRSGFEVVSKLGLERLRELAEAGAGPWDYLDAAGLEPD